MKPLPFWIRPLPKRPPAFHCRPKPFPDYACWPAVVATHINRASAYGRSALYNAPDDPEIASAWPLYAVWAVIICTFTWSIREYIL